MQVRKNSLTGFDQIATSDDPGNGFPVPEKKPYIIFRMPLLDDVDESYYDELEKKGFALLSLPRTIHHHHAYITITNEHKIIRAIKQFFSLPEYRVVENRELFLKLKKFSYQCGRSEAGKRTKYVPPKSKLIDTFEIVPEEKVSEEKRPQSRSETYLVRKKLKPTKHYVFKKSVTGRSITEFEAANGLCYQLLLGRRHPKVRSVHDKQGMRRGVVSAKIPSFESLFTRASTLGLLNKDDIVLTEMVKVWVAGYVEEEMDFHADNYGFDQTGYCVKIDDDRSTWPITSKYLLIDPQSGDKTSHAFNTPPITDFVVTSRDIARFPFLTDARPWFWCDKNETVGCFAPDAIYQAAQEKKFNDDKYYTFLKRILIPDEIYEAIAKVTISNTRKRAVFAAHKIKKTKELREKLIADPGFQRYVMENSDVIKQIIEEWNDYNQELTKAKDHDLRVKRETVKQAFYRLRRYVFLQRGIDLFAVSDVVKAAIIGAAIGLVALGVVAAIFFSLGGALPALGLSAGGLFGLATLVISIYSMLAASIGVLIKKYDMQKPAAKQGESAQPAKTSSQTIFAVLGAESSSRVIPTATPMTDLYVSSSSDEWANDGAGAPAFNQQGPSRAFTPRA